MGRRNCHAGQRLNWRPAAAVVPGTIQSAPPRGEPGTDTPELIECDSALRSCASAKEDRESMAGDCRAGFVLSMHDQEASETRDASALWNLAAQARSRANE